MAESIFSALFGIAFALVACVALLAAVRDAVCRFGWVEPPAGGRLAHWRRAADANGLTRLEETATALEGTLGHLHVRFSRYADAGGHGTRIAIYGGRLSPWLSIAAEPQRGAQVQREVPTGDAGFDRIARVSGPAALARSVLDAPVRRVLEGLLAGRLDEPGRPSFWAVGAVLRGRLQVDVPEVTPESTPERANNWLERDVQRPLSESGSHAVAGPDRLPEVLRRLVALARRLESPPDVPGRLAEVLAKEAEGEVRVQLLTTLTLEARDLPATRDALLAARMDPDPRVRLHAGVALGREGVEALMLLADGEGADDDTTRRAVAALGQRLPIGRAAAILRGALRTRRTATALECLPILASHGGPDAVSLLEKVLAVETPDLAAAAAAALGEAHDRAPAALKTTIEATLDAALDADAVEVRQAATRALGRAGSVAAVPRLKELEQNDSSLRSAARQAIAVIQSRASGAAPGQLSLAVDGGQLSLADTGRGELSLASIPAGPPSPAGEPRAAVREG